MRALAGRSLLPAAVLLAACADRSIGVAVTVPLVATSRNAGEIGRAFLVPRGEWTDVVVEVSGVPPLVASRPVHLYTFLYDGRCDHLPIRPAYALTKRVLARQGAAAGAVSGGAPFAVANAAPLSLDALRRGRYAVVVRTSPADGDVAIYCGEIDPQDG